jgi:cytochrome P450
VIPPLAFCFVLLKWYVFDYFRDPYDLRKYPAPSIAGFSNIWSVFHSRRLRRSRAILQAHQRLGRIVRIQPKHVSFWDPRAVQDIYGHQTVCEKDTFYDTISGGANENIVSTRDRDEHARKRRYIANAFSQRNILSMEPSVRLKVEKLLSRLDRAAAIGEVIDIRQWLNFFTFDVISDMAFGNDPRFLDLGKAETTAQSLDGKKCYAMNPIKAFQDNTVHVASLGHWSAWLSITKPLTKWLPYSKSGDWFTDMCIYQVRNRLSRSNEKDLEGHKDFIHSLLVGSDGKQRNLPFWEVVQEATVFLSAGSDTTASAMTNTLYLLIKHPDVLKKLQEELAAVMSPAEAEEKPDSLSRAVAPYGTVSTLKYLRACLDEGLRHLPPTSIGLLRMTPPQGAVLAGEQIKGGVTVSVPTYTLHHDPTLFSDPWTFKPERWLEGSEEERDNLKRYVIPFTLGKHSCIGRNIAFLEQFVVLSTLVHRYHFEFAQEGFELPLLERINANPGPMPVRVSRR